MRFLWLSEFWLRKLAAITSSWSCASHPQQLSVQSSSRTTTLACICWRAGQLVPFKVCRTVYQHFLITMEPWLCLEISLDEFSIEGNLKMWRFQGKFWSLFFLWIPVLTISATKLLNNFDILANWCMPNSLLALPVYSGSKEVSLDVFITEENLKMWRFQGKFWSVAFLWFLWYPDNDPGRS